MRILIVLQNVNFIGKWLVIMHNSPERILKYLTLERPTIKYSILDQASLPGPLSIFTHKLTYLFNISKWILLRMLYDHYKYNSLLVKRIN